MSKVLVVDDDRDLLAVLRDGLVFERYLVETATTVQEALSYLASTEYDAVVLDWSLPDGSGITVLKEMRGRKTDTPVLMLTGKDGILDKTEGLDSGADDYLTKPFHMRELTSRLRAIIRRHAGRAVNALKCNCLEIEPETHTVLKEGVRIKLAPLEFAVLELLMRYPNRVFNSDKLITRLWPSDEAVGSEAVRACIKRLRQKIGTSKDGVDIVQTNARIGYKLYAPELLSAQEREKAEQELSQEAPAD